MKRHLMAFRWLANDGPLIVAFEYSLPSTTKKRKKKNVVKAGPPLTKHSRSSHVDQDQDLDQLYITLCRLLIWTKNLFETDYIFKLLKTSDFNYIFNDQVADLKFYLI